MKVVNVIQALIHIIQYTLYRKTSPLKPQTQKPVFQVFRV